MLALHPELAHLLMPAQKRYCTICGRLMTSEQVEESRFLNMRYKGKLAHSDCWTVSASEAVERGLGKQLT